MRPGFEGSTADDADVDMGLSELEEAALYEGGRVRYLADDKEAMCMIVSESSQDRLAAVEVEARWGYFCDWQLESLNELWEVYRQASLAWQLNFSSDWSEAKESGAKKDLCLLWRYRRQFMELPRLAAMPRKQFWRGLLARLSKDNGAWPCKPGLVAQLVKLDEVALKLEQSYVDWLSELDCAVLSSGSARAMTPVVGQGIFSARAFAQNVPNPGVGAVSGDFSVEGLVRVSSTVMSGTLALPPAPPAEHEVDGLGVAAVKRV